MKRTRKHLAAAVVSVALVGGLAGAAVATSNLPGLGNGRHMTATARGAMMYGSAWTGQGMGMAANQTMPMSAAAVYLGVSQADLQAQLHAGKSLTDVATAQGKSVAGLKDALTAAMTARVNANTNLSADQKATMLAQVQAHVATMLTSTIHQPGSGMNLMHGQMGAGMHWS